MFTKKSQAFNAENAQAGAAAPFKLLLIDGETRRWIVCEAHEPAFEQFRLFHGHKPSRTTAALWAIPKDAKVGDDLSYTVPDLKKSWEWVKLDLR